MTVYVDDMYRYPMGQFRGMRMSHMIADTEEELHRMAAQIGVARRWYQGDHYDIAQSKRAEALRLGAQAVTLRQLACMTHVRRVTGRLPPADGAAEVAQLLYRVRSEAKREMEEMVKQKKSGHAPEVVWLYDILDMMCGLSFCIFDRMTCQLVRDSGGTMHFTTVRAATDHAVKLAKRHKYEDLIREVPWR